MMQILDAYFSEGSKILYRAGYGIFKLLEKEILKCDTPSKVTKLLTEESLKINANNFFYVISLLYLLTIYRKCIKYVLKRNI